MRIAILGGGISGLAAAWRLSQSNPSAKVTLFEQSSRLGGHIATMHQNGFLFEQGPRTFLSASSPFLLNLIEEVGLKEELIFSQNRSSQRYLWHRGALRSMRSLLVPHFWRFLIEPLIPQAAEEQTVYQFMRSRLGVQIADLFADPFCLGIYAGDCHQLSMHACFPKMVQGSLIKSMFFRPKEGIAIPSKHRFPGKLFTLRRGMQSLIDALHEKLPTEIRFNSPVLSLSQTNNQWEVSTAKETTTFDRIFSALPSPALARLFPDFPPIPHASISVVNIGFSQLDFPHRGYGYLVPSREKESLLGMIWDSELFPQQKGVRLTAMVRGDASDPEQIARQSLRSHLGISEEPDLCEATYIHEAIPQPTLGHVQRLNAWNRPNLIPLGAYLSGVSVEQCIQRAETEVHSN